jgi:hypothetical protein
VTVVYCRCWVWWWLFFTLLYIPLSSYHTCTESAVSRCCRSRRPFWYIGQWGTLRASHPLVRQRPSSLRSRATLDGQSGSLHV